MANRKLVISGLSLHLKHHQPVAVAVAAAPCRQLLLDATVHV
jgi:hypothetical protein